MKFELCSSCKEPTNNYTWLRQRIICRHCWEIKCHDEVMMIPHSGSGEEE